MPQHIIEITEHQTPPIVEHSFLDGVIRQVLSDEQIDVATISLALISDAEIRAVNRQFLGHDYPTDVISFRLDEPVGVENRVEDAATMELSEFVGPDSGQRACLEQLRTIRRLTAPPRLEGELIVSTETAIREAPVHGWSPRAELILYVVHGLLHLCGYDDVTDEARPVMRSRERELLALWGFCPTGLEQ